MKFIRAIPFIIIALIIVWIDMPGSYHLNFQIGNRKIHYELKPLSVNFNFFGTPVRKTFETKLGLDLSGGSHLVFEADTSAVSFLDREDAIQSSRNIIEKRVNLFGISEPVIQTVKSGNIYRISVDLPGVTDTAEAVQLIGKTAQLSFREQLEVKDPALATLSAGLMLFNPETNLKGGDVRKATVEYDPQNGQPTVKLAFSPAGTKTFADMTTKNVGKPIGIFLDENAISAPVVQQPILTGDAVISGNFTLDEAKNLAISINSGALPVPIKLVEQQKVGPSLGQAEIDKSIKAGLVGLGAVMLFMVLYYRRMGVVACIGLLIYGLLTFALFRAIPVVLTLSGIAGFILSIGMAVDSNILIFERIREEERKGKERATAIRIGFGRAIDAIKDANITTLLVAFILFNPLNWEFFPEFGLIRGFALTLAIGVAMSLFTGVFITKKLILLFYSSELNKK